MMRPTTRDWLISALCLVPAMALAQGPGHADAPPRPQKGEYTWAEPKDWTPPTLEELQKVEWKDGWVATGKQLEAARAATIQAQISEQEALTLPNTSKEANQKILSILSRPPKDEEVDWDATINRAIDGAPGTLNCILASSKYESQVCGLIAGGAWSFDHTLKPLAVGEVVKTWKTNPMMNMIVLHDDLVWEDGTPMTAYDFEFSYHLIMDDRINVPAVRAGTEDLKWVKAYDAQTLVYFHKEPRVTNVWNCNFAVLPKHIYSVGLAEDPTMRTSEWNVYWNLHPISGGSYQVKEHQTGQLILLERRENFYKNKEGKEVRDKPYIKQIRMRVIAEENAKLLAFKKGDIDELLLNARQWASETDDADFKKQGLKVRGTEWAFTYIGWNQKPVPDVPYFKDSKVRWAMTYALNHEELLQKLNFGLYDAGAGPFHPESWMAQGTIKPVQQDLDKAEELLDEAGWVDTDDDGLRDKTIDGKKWQFEFSAVYGQGSPVEKALILLKEDLERIGVRMNIKSVEFATMQQQFLEHRFEASAAGWGTGADPDTSSNLWTTRAYNDGRNYAGFASAEVDKLYEDGAKEFDLEKRGKIYQRINQIIWEDQPFTFLYYRSSLWAFSKKVRGYNFSPRDPFSYSPGFSSLWIPKAKS